MISDGTSKSQGCTEYRDGIKKEENISPKASLVAIMLFWAISSEVEEDGGESFCILTRKEQYLLLVKAISKPVLETSLYQTIIKHNKPILRIHRQGTIQYIEIRTRNFCFNFLSLLIRWSFYSTGNKLSMYKFNRTSGSKLHKII